MAATPVPFYSEFSNLPISKLRAFLDECDQPFEPSQLYSPAAEAKYVDTGQRVSEFRAVVDGECFGLADELVAAVNNLTPSNGIHFSLVRSDVTEISYQPGGFFKRHQDFLSVQGNVVEEHTMLVCVTADDAAAMAQGGATIIHQLGKSHKLTGTTIPGHAVVFRKDLEHEGELLGAGEKRIVSLNLLAIRDRSPEDQVLHVTFPCLAGSHESDVDALRAAADGERSYALAAADVSSEPLKNCIEWANQQAAAANQPRASVLPYCERLFSFEAFGTVFRILTRQHVSADDLVSHRAALDYYFPGRLPFDAILAELAPADLLCEGSTVMVDGLDDNEMTGLNCCRGTILGKRRDDGTFAVRVVKRPASPLLLGEAVGAQAEAPAGAAVDVVLDQTNLLLDEESVARHLSTSAKAVSEAAEPFDASVICCESEERRRVVAAVARKLGLPYVPFRIIFVEGVLTTTGDCVGPDTPVHVPMIPAWISLGDYDNILYYRKLGHLVPQGVVVSSSMEAVAEECFGFGPEAFDPEDFEAELHWPHHNKAKHGPIDPQMDQIEASLVLNSVLLDLPAGTKIDLAEYNLGCGYSHPQLLTPHFRLRVTLDTAEPQKTMHEIIFNDHRESPTKRVWLPGGEDYGDCQLPGMEIKDPP